MAAKKAASGKAVAIETRIELHRFVHFRVGGPVELTGRFTSESPFAPGQVHIDERPIRVEQPNPWTTDDQILTQVRKQYPSATVSWLPDV
jgi:hypothetical protein